MHHPLVALFAFAVTSAAWAQSNEATAGEPHRVHGPPAEAVAACNGQGDGAACGFTFEGKNLTGTCRTTPKGVAACMPAGFEKHHGHHGPPPQALDACKGLSAGAACSVKFEERTVTGTCNAGREGELACRPADLPEFGPGRGGHHRPPPEALEACKSLAAGAACSVTFKEKTLSGTCRQGPNQEAAACMPNRPDEK